MDSNLFKCQIFPKVVSAIRNTPISYIRASTLLSNECCLLNDSTNDN